MPARGTWYPSAHWRFAFFMSPVVLQPIGGDPPHRGAPAPHADENVVAEPLTNYLNDLYLEVLAQSGLQLAILLGSGQWARPCESTAR